MMLNRWTLLSLLVATRAGAVITGPALVDQGFTFDHQLPGQPWIIPTVPQCSTIPLKWQRGGTGGPSPIAPYSLEVYASAFTTPFTVNAGDGSSFNWPVPFDNGTVFQVCMFASNGVTGGCWEDFTVTPGNTGCQNVTFPTRLGVTATVSKTETQAEGTLSQFGWIEECSDIQLQPTDGQPPYVMTIAPTLRTPINITSDNTDLISWKVSLDRAVPFYVSLASADGKSWSNGPLHVAPSAITNCTGAASNPSSSAGGMISESKAIGASVGSLIAGLVIGLVCALLITWLRNRKHRDQELETGSFSDIPKTSNIGTPVSPDALSPLRSSEPVISSATASMPGSLPYVTETTTVIRRHHDGGSYLTPDNGGQVAELPPDYMTDAGREPSDGNQRLHVVGPSDEDGEGSSRGQRMINPSGRFPRDEKKGITR